MYSIFSYTEGGIEDHFYNNCEKGLLQTFGKKHSKTEIPRRNVISLVVEKHVGIILITQTID